MQRSCDQQNGLSRSRCLLDCIKYDELFIGKLPVSPNSISSITRLQMAFDTPFFGQKSALTGLPCRLLCSSSIRGTKSSKKSRLMYIISRRVKKELDPG